MNQLRVKDKFGLLAVMFNMIWAPLQVWYLHVDGAGRFTFFILVLAFLILFTDIIKFALKRPLSIYVILTIYIFINGLIKDSAATFEKDGLLVMTFGLFIPIMSMLIVATVSQRLFDKSVKYIAWTLWIYCALCLINSSENYLDENRLYSELNANEMSLNAAIDFGLFLLLFIRKKIRFSIVFIVVPVALIILSASRMGMGMIFVIALSYIIVLLNLKSTKGFGGASILVVALLLSSVYVMNNTMVGKRLMMTTTQIENTSQSTGTILDYFGDRGYQYYASWSLFLENPVTGIGFHKWASYNPTNHVCHSEYMVQYLENGLIAFSLFFLFWIIMLYRLFKKKIKNKGITNNTASFLIGILVSIIYSNLVLWSYNIVCVFTIYALCFAFTIKENNQTLLHDEKK